MRAAVMEPADAEALADLTHHWGSAYLITRPSPGVWVAQRRDDRGTIRADGPDLLWAMIRADYDAAPVPRQGGPR